MTTSKRTVSGIDLALGGPHQRTNALLALEAMDQLHQPPADAETVRNALGNVHALSGLRARQEWVYPDVMIDVAHNEEALRATLSSFLDATGDMKRTIVLGFLEDKELGGLGGWLAKRVESASESDLRLVFVDTDGARGMPASAAADRWVQSGWSGSVEVAQDLLHCILEARERGHKTLVAGSYRVACRLLEGD